MVANRIDPRQVLDVLAFLALIYALPVSLRAFHAISHIARECDGRTTYLETSHVVQSALVEIVARVDQEAALLTAADLVQGSRGCLLLWTPSGLWQEEK